MTQKIEEQEMSTRLQEIATLDEIEVGGETFIDDEVVAAITGMAAKEVEGVSELGGRSLRRTVAERVAGANEHARGVEVEAGRKEAILDLEMRVLYGFSVPEIVIKVRQLVAQRVLELLGLVTKEINIRVVGIDFTDRIAGRVE